MPSKTTNNAPQLLWVDDDERERFEGEIAAVVADGWSITWAANVPEAARLLSKRRFDAVLLDQMIAGPYGVEARVVVWGGCRLLHWLRGSREEPWHGDDPSWEALARLRPLARNRTALVALVSAYHDDEVLRATRAASPEDAHLLLFSKPIDLAGLRRFLKRVIGAQ